MALERVLNNPGTDTVYIWDTQKKRWLLTPDVTVPILESTPPAGGYAATNIYVDKGTGKVVIDYDTKS